MGVWTVGTRRKQPTCGAIVGVDHIRAYGRVVSLGQCRLYGSGLVCRKRRAACACLRTCAGRGSANKQNAVVRLGSRRDMVQPVWSGVTIIVDEISLAGKGEIEITAVMLMNTKILRVAGFHKQQSLLV